MFNRASMRRPRIAIVLLLLALTTLVTLAATATTSAFLPPQHSPTQKQPARPHVKLDLAATEAEQDWLARPDHPHDEKQAFLTAFQIAASVSERVDEWLSQSLQTRRSLLEQLGGSVDQAASQASETLSEWATQGRITKRSAKDVATFHAREALAALIEEADPPPLVANGTHASHSPGGGDGEQHEPVLADEGAVHAGIGAALRSDRSSQAGWAAPPRPGEKRPSGSALSRRHLVRAAAQWALRPISAAHVVHRALAGPLGDSMRAHGPVALQGPAAQALLARALLELAAELLRSPMARAEVAAIDAAVQGSFDRPLAAAGAAATPLPFIPGRSGGDGLRHGAPSLPSRQQQQRPGGPANPSSQPASSPSYQFNQRGLPQRRPRVKLSQPPSRRRGRG